MSLHYSGMHCMLIIGCSYIKCQSTNGEIINFAFSHNNYLKLMAISYVIVCLAM
jgi:hypothetical protein